jgi:hypothetical protein
MAINRQQQVRRITDDQIEAMREDVRPSFEVRHLPSVRVLRQVINEIAYRQRARKGDAASGEYCDDTAGQIASATGISAGTVKDAFAVLAASGWVPIIRREVRHGGRQSGCRRYLAVIHILGLDDGNGVIPPPPMGVGTGNDRLATGQSRESRRGNPATPDIPDIHSSDDRAPAAINGGDAPDLATSAERLRQRNPRAAAVLDRVNAGIAARNGATP